MANSTLLQMLEIKAWEPPTDILYPKESRSLVRCCLNLMSSTALFSNLQRITHHIRWIVFITWRGAFHLLWIDQFQRLVALHARPPLTITFVISLKRVIYFRTRLPRAFLFLLYPVHVELHFPWPWHSNLVLTIFVFAGSTVAVVLDLRRIKL